MGLLVDELRLRDMPVEVGVDAHSFAYREKKQFPEGSRCLT